MPRLVTALVAGLFAVASYGCDEEPTDDSIDLSQFDQSCRSDDDCVSVAESNHCGPCAPPCKLRAISEREHEDFVERRESIHCSTTERLSSGWVYCEPCPTTRARCIDGICKGCFESGGERHRGRPVWDSTLHRARSSGARSIEGENIHWAQRFDSHKLMDEFVFP